MKKIKSLIQLLTLVILLGSMNICYAREDIMPLSEVQQGMTGVVKTVITGTTMEEFAVEVLGIVAGNGSSVGDMILVRTSGSLIERTGGVVQGMSGSPVYIQGKLVGAIARGWALSDPKIVMVTPIENMIKILEHMEHQEIVARENRARENALRLENVRKRVAEELQKSELKIATINNAAAEEVKEEPINKDKDESAEKKPVASTEVVESEQDKVVTEKTTTESVEKKTEEENGEKRVSTTAEQEKTEKVIVNKSTPLSVSGFTTNSLEFLTEKLKKHDMVPYTADLGGKAFNSSGVEIQGGSAVALLLTTGDVSMGASGTVTMVEEDKILAFGHEFMRRGDIEYFMAEAVPVAVLPSINAGQRITNIGKVIGTFKQDRTNGLAGRLGEVTASIPIRISLKDLTTGKTENVSVRMVRDEILVPLISEAVLFNAIDILTDRIGHGTAKVSINVTGDLPDNKEISHSNMYYSPTSVASLATAELGVAMDMLMNNRFQKINVNAISVDVEVVGEALVNKIIGASTKTTKAKPGDIVTIEITSSTYRGENIVEKLDYMIPKDYKEDKANLLIRGGASIAWVQALLEQQQKEQGLLKREIDKNKTLSQYIDEFNKMDSNNVVVIDILPTANKLTQKQMEKMAKEMTESAMTQQANIPSLLFGSPNKKSYPVNYIVNGDTRLTIEIEKEKI